MSDRIIYKSQWITVPFKIPDDCYICPDCKGEGEFRVGYDGGHDRDFIDCTLCQGKGYLNPEDIGMWNRIGSKEAKDKMRELTKKSLTVGNEDGGQEK